MKISGIKSLRASSRLSEAVWLENGTRRWFVPRIFPLWWLEMDRKDCFCRRPLYAQQDGTFMMLGLGMGWREFFSPTHPIVATIELEHSIFWQKALWEQLVLKSILCVRLGQKKQANRLGLMKTEDKTIRGRQRQYGLLDGSEDQKVWVPVTDGSVTIWPWHHTALRPFQLRKHYVPGLSPHGKTSSALLPSPGRRISMDYSKSRILAESLIGKVDEKAIYGS